MGNDKSVVEMALRVARIFPRQSSMNALTFGIEDVADGYLGSENVSKTSLGLGWVSMTGGHFEGFMIL